MANKTSASIGTALQFMPQADKQGVESLQGIKGVTGSVGTGDIGGASASKGLDALTGAFATYLDTKDKQFQKEMWEGAKNILARASEEDLQKLNSIEIATKYGYATLIDNPYFHAYTDNLIGEHNAQLAYTDYNTLFADRPAKTPEEEAQRFDKWMLDRANSYLSTKPQTNATAFQEGFASKKHDVFQNMMQQRSTKEVSDKVAIAQASISTDLQNISYNATNRPVEDVIADYQQVLDKSRMIAMQPEFTYKMLQSIPMALAKYGRMNIGDIKRVMDSLDVEVRLDGTTRKASEFVSANEYAPAAIAWQQSHTTQFKLDIVNKYKSDKDLSRMDMDIAKRYQSQNPADWNTAQIMESWRGDVAHAQAQIQRSRKKTATQAVKTATKQAQMQDDETLWRANIQLALEGNSNALDVFGNSEGVVRRRDGKNADTAIRDKVLFNMVGETLGNENMDYASRLKRVSQLMHYKGANDFSETYGKRLLNNMLNMADTDLNAGIIEPAYVNLYNMYLNSTPTEFGGAFGTKVSDAFSTIRGLGEASGYNNTDAFAIGISKWKAASKMSQDEKNSYNSQITKYINDVKNTYGAAPDIQGMANISTGTYDTITVDRLNGSSTFYNIAAMYMYNGMSVDRAVEMAGNDIRDNYVYKWGAVIPKTLFLDNFPSDINDTWKDKSEALGSLAINTLAAFYFGDASLGARKSTGVGLSAVYHPNTGEITVQDAHSGKSMTIPRTQLWNEMQYIAGNTDYIEVKQSKASSDGDTDNGTLPNIISALKGGNS